MGPLSRYKTPAGRTSYKKLAFELDRENQKLVKELDRIPRWVRDICAKLRSK